MAPQERQIEGLKRQGGANRPLDFRNRLTTVGREVTNAITDITARSRLEGRGILPVEDTGDAEVGKADVAGVVQLEVNAAGFETTEVRQRQEQTTGRVRVTIEAAGQRITTDDTASIGSRGTGWR